MADKLKDILEDLVNKGKPKKSLKETINDGVVEVLNKAKNDLSFKGEKGEKGDSIVGPKGDKGEIGPRGPIGPKGDKPIAGIDYQLPKDGQNGQDGSPDTPDQVRDKLQALKGKDRLDISAIKGVEHFVKLGGQSTVGKKINTADERWHGGGAPGTVTDVTASAPLSSSGGTTPNITISQAGVASDGYLSSVDWNTFNNKQSATAPGADTQVIFNDGGAFGADAGLTFNKTTKLLSLTGAINLPTTSSATAGVLNINSVSFLHQFGNIGNIFLGYQAGNFTMSGASDNVGLGRQSLSALTSGDDNVAGGSYSLLGLTIGSRNVALGKESLTTVISGNNNTGVGYSALINVTASDNTAVGRNAGERITSGSQNTFLGSLAGQDSVTGQTITNATAIGYNTQVAVSNALILGNGVNVGIGNTNPGALLDLGLAGTTLGVIRFAGSTSGNVSLRPNAVAGTNIVQTLQAITGTIALLSDIPASIVTGTGTTNKLTKWLNTSGGLTDSIVTENTNNISIAGNLTLAITGTSIIDGLIQVRSASVSSTMTGGNFDITNTQANRQAIGFQAKATVSGGGTSIATGLLGEAGGNGTQIAVRGIVTSGSVGVGVRGEGRGSGAARSVGVEGRVTTASSSGHDFAVLANGNALGVSFGNLQVWNDTDADSFPVFQVDLDGNLVIQDLSSGTNIFDIASATGIITATGEYKNLAYDEGITLGADSGSRIYRTVTTSERMVIDPRADSGDGFLAVGTAITSGSAASATADNFSSMLVQTSNTGTRNRAAFLGSEYAASTDTTANMVGLNAIVMFTAAGGSSDSSVAGNVGGRYAIRGVTSSATGTVAKAVAVSGQIANTSSSAVTFTEADVFQIEPMAALTGTITLGNGIKFNAPTKSSTGTFTTFNGIFFPFMNQGTTTTPTTVNAIFFTRDTGVGARATNSIHFNEAGNTIGSLQANRLDYTVPSAGEHRFNVNAALELTIAADIMTFNSGSTDPVLSWATDGFLNLTTGRFSVQTGTSATLARVGGAIFDYFTDSSVGGAETDIYTSTTPANTLTTNGDKLVANYGGNFVTVGTEIVQLKVYFGGTAIWDSTGVAVTTGTTSWRVYVEIIRVSSSVVRYTVSLNTTGASGFVYATSGELTGLTLSNTNIIKITGTSSGVGSGAGDIVGKMGSVSWIPAA